MESGGDLKEIYIEVFNELSKNDPNLKYLKKGVLYKIIQLILLEEKLESQEKTKQICLQLGIRENANLNDDQKIISKLTEAVFLDQQFLERKGAGLSSFLSNFSVGFNQSIADEEDRMRWFVITACALVGVIACVKYITHVQGKHSSKAKNQVPVPPPSPPPPIPASLCLIIPASLARDLENKHSVDLEYVESLVNACSYFLCTSNKKADGVERTLGLDETNPLPDSENQEIYVKILVENGRNLIDKTTRYELKKNLLSNKSFAIARIACLKDLSRLKDFVSV